ncbi:MAG TPA: BON domain-containing protein [Candidatus Acidoferrales bacterium]|nr:BON domain-containing protein [Candidatus Acidoferrales bacterium]
MRILKLSILLLTCQFLLGGAGINAKQDNSSHRGPRNGDQFLQREVGHELNMVPWYSVFDILKYSVHDQEVTLSGAVVNPTTKTDAENAVKHIEGVEKVNDQVEVLPPSPMDDEIRRAEYRAIYSQGTLSRYGLGALQSIHIIVKGGHVTLEGSVDNQADKNAAGIYANGVPNVFSVNNNLQVTGGK